MANLVLVAAVIVVVSLPVAAAGERPVPSGGPAGEAAAGAQAFYRAYVAAQVQGIPDRRARQRLAPYLSRALLAALRDADAGEQRHRVATHDSEPPLWEGDLFSSMFEGATEAQVAECRATGKDRARCAVALAWRDPDGGKPEQWRDQATLVREGGRYVVDDIAYGGTWDFRNMGTLRASLRDVAAYRP